MPRPVVVCLMGLNVNHGEKILLRIRTDDFTGFRKYLYVRDVLMHELAHSMGLTVMRGWNKAPPGLGYPKTVDENDPDTGNKGHVYDNAHGGSGSHCANGLSDGQKSGSDYDSSWANCGMLDNGPSTDPSPFNGFCDQCQEYIKARDISDITRSFK